MEKANFSNTPICDFVRDYSTSEYSRFHMPGHKGLQPSGSYTTSDLPSLPFSYDITEIKGADSLYEAAGVIAQSEAKASELFDTEATLFSTEGSSQCIRAMLALVTKWKNNARRPIILAARNVHRSFLTAAAMLDFDIRWLYPEGSSYSLCSCPVTASQVRKALEACEQLPCAVYLTSPDYLGNMQDIKSISEAAHSFGIPLLVDNAHGSYLRFLDKSLHPINLGADICCDSAHKTLPALTGCAYLHISKSADRCFIKNAKKAMSLFGSTSPSYILLESLDLVNDVLATTFRSQLEKHIKRITQAKNSLRFIGWKLFEDSDNTGDYSLFESTKITGDCSLFESTKINGDCSLFETNKITESRSLYEPMNVTENHALFEPMKITIDARSFYFTGSELSELLRQNKIECEYADPDYVVLMPSPYTSEDDFEKLLRAMKEIAQSSVAKGASPAVLPDSLSFIPPEEKLTARQALSFIPPEEKLTARQALSFIPPEEKLSVRQAMFSSAETVPVEESAGRICADTALFCPPAVPLVVCGELITDEHIPLLKYYGFDSISVVEE